MSYLRTVLIAALVAAGSAAASTAQSLAPEPLPKSSVYVEHGNFGGLLSVNLERSFRERVSLRLGAAIHQGPRSLIIPMGASYLFDTSRLAEGSRFEFGLGTAFWPAGNGIRKVGGAAFEAAFRQPLRGGRWFYRVSFISTQDRLWPGLSLGHGL